MRFSVEFTELLRRRTAQIDDATYGRWTEMRTSFSSTGGHPAPLHQRSSILHDVYKGYRQQGSLDPGTVDPIRKDSFDYIRKETL
jgi:hypothetical protein